MLRRIACALSAALLTAALVSCSGAPAAEVFDQSYPEPPGPSRAAAVETHGQDRTVIVFTFDDGPLSDYLLAYPILKEYGIKGTSYIITKYTEKGTKGKLTWEQIEEMADYGWVFGAHTYGHINLAAFTNKEIKEDCEKVMESFTDHGLAVPEIMAYPYGTQNSRVIKAIKPFYRQARLAYYKTDLVDPVKTDPYKIPSVSADMQTKARLKEVEELVDKACKKGKIIVFRVHVLYREHPCDTVKRSNIHSGGAPQTSSKLFGELVKYCVDKGCVFMTMTELMDYMEQQQG